MNPHSRVRLSAVVAPAQAGQTHLAPAWRVRGCMVSFKGRWRQSTGWQPIVSHGGASRFTRLQGAVP
jgi:hypothetical protein